MQRGLWLGIGLATLAVAACSGPDPLERARVAAGRAPTTTLPAVPGEGEPYPSLGTVPARPATTPPAERRALEDALVADRANARYVGQPVVPTVPRAAAAAPVAAAAPAPLEATGGMLMGAEETTPPPLGAPPVPPIAGAPVAAEPLAAQAVAAPPPPQREAPAASPPAPAAITMEPLPPPPAPAMPEELSAGARAAAAAAAAPAPVPPPEPSPLPSVPPPPAMAPAAMAPAPAPVAAAAPTLLPGAARDPAPAPPPTLPATPPVAAAPAQPPAAPPQPSVVVDRSALLPARASPAGQAYALSFLPGTETLVTQDRAVLAGLASRGRGATFQVTGYGDEAAPGRSLDLPLARAQVVADLLRAAGVPAEAIELGGTARQGPAGRGAEVRLVYSR